MATQPTRTLYLRDGFYLYELVMQGNTIRRTTRFVEKNQEGRDFSWFELDEDIQKKLMEKINEEREDESE